MAKIPVPCLFCLLIIFTFAIADGFESVGDEPVYHQSLSKHRQIREALSKLGNATKVQRPKADRSGTIVAREPFPYRNFQEVCSQNIHNVINGDFAHPGISPTQRGSYKSGKLATKLPPSPLLWSPANYFTCLDLMSKNTSPNICLSKDPHVQNFRRRLSRGGEPQLGHNSNSFLYT